MKFNEKLKYLRESKSFTQDEIASRLNIARQSVSKWEQGINEPDIETLKKLCVILDCSIGDLIDDDKEIVTTKEEKDERKTKWLFYGTIMVAIASLLVLVALIFAADNDAIIHWGPNGEEHGSKWNLLWLGVMFVILPFIALIIRVACKKSEHYNKVKVMMQATGFAMSVLISIVFFVVLAFSIKIDNSIITNVMPALVFSIVCAIGPFTNPKFAKRSVIFGFRTNLTLSSEEAWNKVNNFCSYVLTGSCFVGYVLVLIFIHETWAVGLFGIIFIGLIASIIYHEKVRKDINNKNQ